MKTNWLGLWKSENRKDKAVYSSSVLNKKQIEDLPNKCRVVLMRNKYKNEYGTSPDYVFSFMDAEGYEETIISQSIDKLNILRNGLEEIAERCRGKYLDNDNDDFLYDTYQYCYQLIKESYNKPDER